MKGKERRVEQERVRRGRPTMVEGTCFFPVPTPPLHARGKERCSLSSVGYPRSTLLSLLPTRSERKEASSIQASSLAPGPSRTQNERRIPVPKARRRASSRIALWLETRRLGSRTEARCRRRGTDAFAGKIATSVGCRGIAETERAVSEETSKEFHRTLAEKRVERTKTFVSSARPRFEATCYCLRLGKAFSSSAILTRVQPFVVLHPGRFFVSWTSNR